MRVTQLPWWRKGNAGTEFIYTIGGVDSRDLQIDKRTLDRMVRVLRPASARDPVVHQLVEPPGNGIDVSLSDDSLHTPLIQNGPESNVCTVGRMLIDHFRRPVAGPVAMSDDSQLPETLLSGERGKVQ